MFTGLTHTALAGTLAAVGPVELKGVALLRRCHPAPLLPAGVDPGELAAAAVELIDYTRACEAARRRLAALRPIAVTGATIEGFGL